MIRKRFTHQEYWFLKQKQISKKNKTLLVQWQSLYCVRNHLEWADTDMKQKSQRLQWGAVAQCLVQFTCPWLNDHQVNQHHSLSRQQKGANSCLDSLSPHFKDVRTIPCCEWRRHFFFSIGFVDEWSSHISCRKQKCQVSEFIQPEWFTKVPIQVTLKEKTLHLDLLLGTWLLSGSLRFEAQHSHLRYN